MCGIAGIRRFDGGPVDPGLIEAMAASLRHRGPDESGTWIHGSVGFGHCRLSIIDVSGSHQPMATPDERLHVVFNGEILNYESLRGRVASYPFQTRGDTEVLLALFDKEGPASVELLRGQFAYAVHDGRNGETHLFRDRFGILPLFYYSNSEFFAFASEIKALLPLISQPRVDEASLHDYLSHRSIPAPHTLIDGVSKVRPGHHLVVRPDGSIRSEPYWQLPSPPAGLDVSASDAVRMVDQALESSVDEALVADVPVGLYLSGGVDSSLLTALASRRSTERVHTFSASFGDDRFDESQWALKVSGLFGTEHHDVRVTAEDFLDNWGRLSWHRDGPLSEPADVAINRLATLARQQVKVVLSGEGSDEIFGGYPKYRYAKATRWLGGKPVAPLFRMVETALPSSKSKMRTAVRAMSERTYAERMRAWFAPFTLDERDRLLGGPATRSALAPYEDGSGDAVRRMLYADMFTWLSDNLLERGDRMSMAASLETRPPFLDHRLVELAFSLPSRHKVRKGTTKWVIKEVALRHLPSDVVNRPKIGFKVPLDAWFRGGLRDFAHDLLTGPESFVGERLDRSEVSNILNAHLGARRNEELRIWTLLSLEVWHREMRKRGVW
jgi:asparagine synthase (glutamine-hydrolysing)